MLELPVDALASRPWRGLAALGSLPTRVHPSWLAVEAVVPLLSAARGSSPEFLAGGPRPGRGRFRGRFLTLALHLALAPLLQVDFSELQLGRFRTQAESFSLTWIAYPARLDPAGPAWSRAAASPRRSCWIISALSLTSTSPFLAVCPRARSRRSSTRCRVRCAVRPGSSPSSPSAVVVMSKSSAAPRDVERRRRFAAQRRAA